MKIALFSDSFHPYISGATFVVLNQANELIRRGHEVAIFRPKPIRKRKHATADLIGTSASVYNSPLSIPTFRLQDLHIVVPTFLPTYHAIKRFEPDVIHAHTEWGCGWEGCFAAKLRRTPMVGTFHTFWGDPAYLQHFHLPPFKFVQKAMWHYSRVFYGRCDTIISPSQEVKDQLLAYGLKRDPVIVSNGIYIPPLRPEEEIKTLRETYGLPTDQPVFIYVGRVSQEKSLDVVLRAFSKVNEKFPESRFVMVGGGPVEDTVDKEIERLNLKDAVIRTGSVDHEKLIKENIFRLGDIFLTASTTENQPVSILEAMAFSQPVIGAAAKGIPELVENEKNGFLFEPGNETELATHMERLYTDPVLRERLSDGSFQTAQEHSIERTGDRLVEIYQAAIERRKKH
jgi:1,2-diacylglycerol 3-alpha-glucosyltransferase